MTNPYSCRFVADRRTLSLVEVSTSERERTVRAVMGGGPAWEIILPIWYLPAVAFLGPRTAAVWAATRLFVLTQGEQPIRVDFDDEIHAVYSVGEALCVVSELSVVLYDPQRSVIVDRFVADDVLSSSWWQDDRLFVESATGSTLTFAPNPLAVGYLPAH